MVEEGRGDYHEAATRLREALDTFRSLSNTPFVAFTLNALGISAYQRGELDWARTLLTEALDRFQAIGETHGTGFVFTNLAKVELASGNLGRAAAHYRESLARWQEHGERVSIAGCLRGLGNIAALSAQPEVAARLFGAAEALRETVGLPDSRHSDRYYAAVTSALAALGDAQFHEAWCTGRQLPLAEAVALALTVASEIDSCEWPD
jgi:tetratricopeptide (TPR) repeat protein